MRSDPPRSVPSASANMPVASPAAPPPVDPPAESAGSHGLRVAPKTSLKVFAPAANSGVLVLPTTTAPAARRRRTTSASSSGTWSAYSRQPYVVRSPATGVMSLIPTGTPASGPASSPRARRRSIARASSSARGESVTTAFTLPLWRPMRSSAAETTSSADTSRAATSACRSATGRKARSRAALTCASPGLRSYASPRFSAAPCAHDRGPRSPPRSPPRFPRTSTLPARAWMLPSLCSPPRRSMVGVLQRMSAPLSHTVTLPIESVLLRLRPPTGTRSRENR